MSEFRGPHDLRAGDRVLVVNDDGTDGICIGEVRCISKIGKHDWDYPVRLLCGYQYKPERFLRIAEPGETPPKGTWLRSVTDALAGMDDRDYTHLCGSLIFPQVVVSIPEPEHDPRASELAELRSEVDAIGKRLAALEDSDG